MTGTAAAPTTSTDWVGLIAAVSAAGAAMAALGNVIAAQRRDARNRRPNLIMQVEQVTRASQLPVGTIVVTNVGYGPAIAPNLFGVLMDGRPFMRESLGVTILQAGERVASPLGVGELIDGLAPPAVVVWHDVSGRVCWSKSTGRGLYSARPGPWPRRYRSWPLITDLFKRAYPEIEVPELGGTGTPTGT